MARKYLTKHYINYKDGRILQQYRTSHRGVYKQEDIEPHSGRNAQLG